VLALAGILLALGAAWLVLSPFATRARAPLTDGPDRVAELRELYALRDVAYETLRDLEFDFHAGKISDADYRELTDKYRGEAFDLVRRIDAVEAGPGATPAKASPPPAGR
jgi:hypothetical protein